MRIGLRFKLGFIFLMFLALNVSAFGVMQTFLKAQEPDAVNINLAGKQRMLSQKMSKEAALIIYDADTPESRKILDETAKLFDRTLKGFGQGDTGLGLIPTTQSNILAELKKGQEAWQPFYEKIQIVAGNNAKEQKFAAFDYINKHNLELVNQMNTVTGLYEADSKAKTKRLIYIQLILAFLNLLLVSIAWTLTESRIIRPIRNLSQKTKELAEGNLVIEVSQVKDEDEIGVLYQSYRLMLEKLKALVNSIQINSKLVENAAGELSRSADQTSSGTEQVVKTIQNIADGSKNQVVEIESIQTTIEGIGEFIGNVFESAQELTSTANNASRKAEDGNKILDQANQKMDRVASKINSAMEQIQELGQKTGEITNIVSTIMTIAEQTNLLALNAAIEAARAGETGRGFAVVADEVRNLAVESSNATVDVQNIITEIQARTKEVIDSMETGNQEFQEGHQIVKSAGEVFVRLLDASSSVDEKSVGVTEAIRRVIEGTQTIHNKVKQVQEVAESSAAAAQVVAVASEETLTSMENVYESTSNLSRLAGGLTQQVAHFKVRAESETDFAMMSDS
ncbi:methyl-accepting chemotaxis protein [Desulfitobacterium sp. AusDCA]|uniref:methyl-accepting chemotaxis protein n=1 Tax=Desulfitobacterium sp. AusDCA TaxID=3240383 RepID=UPI003DA6E8F8